MSMFYTIYASGSFDKKGDSWDDGITKYSEPIHQTKRDMEAIITKKMHKEINLDKATCPDVQEYMHSEKDGKRYIRLAVKAMGYAHALEKAKQYCNAVYKIKHVKRKNKVSARDLMGFMGYVSAVSSKASGGRSYMSMADFGF